ncbi:6-bladed beta-propeller protein [Mucilaginibacter oryzae]|uniref:6-bladed beta-propeller protein n=1 Tax=Mucilaginibacter oryzae TaxID=468058 RepID=A0A316GTF1_9SPHI|nr:6-bladed beta-propeller [Mucilaginibacter oryzae]PWK64896.1 6-bladed beta-propeller protein [Mucilaginibacter oryzae]
MYTTRFAVVFFALIFCISCREAPKKELPFKYQVHINSIKESVNYDDIVDSYKYIALKAPHEAKVGKFWKILFYKDKLFVASYGVFCFDLNGNFLYKLTKMGDQQSEFSHIDDFSIDNDKIYLYDNHLSKILIFSSSDGSFLEEVKLIYSVKQLQVVNNNLFMNQGEIPNAIDRDLIISCKVDEQSSPKSFIPIGKYYWSTSQQLFSYNKNVYWIDQIFDKVYKIHSNQVENYIRYDFGQRNVTCSEALEQSYDLLRRRNKAYKLSNVYETNNLIFSNLMIGSDFVYTIYSKRSGKYICYKNVVDKPYQTLPTAIAVYGDYFCSLLTKDLIAILNAGSKKMGANIDARDKDFENYKVIKNYQSNYDNPIVALYKLKI